jgi:hypothetical protein
VILRKPYAFLIKNFRLIHILLTILLGYVSFKTANLLGFLNDYIKNGFYGIDTKILINDYISLAIFIVIFLIIGISATIFLLMRIKDKPRLFYMINILFYIVITILFVMSYFDLVKLAVTEIDPRKIRITRDLLFISSIFQYIMVAVTFFRATGFNIKKFNFQEDIEELNIDVSDDEEFELMVGVDPHAVRTRLRKKLRIVKYVFLENVVVITIAVVVLSMFTGAYILLNTQVFNKIYQSGDIVRINGFDIKFLNAYQTDKDYRGKIIDNNSSFIIVNVYAKNKYIKDLMVDVKRLKLNINNNKYYATEDYHKYFTDIEIKPFSYQEKSPNSEEQFSLVYKINNRDKNKKIIVEYLTDIEKNKAIRIRIKPNDLSKETRLISNKKIGSKVSFNESLLKNSFMTINSYEIKDEFIYDYKLCILKECSDMKDYISASTLTNYDKTLVQLNINASIDQNLYNKISIGDLIEYYGTFKYVVEGQEKTQDVALINRTPINYIGDNVYIEALKELESATSIDLILNIRSKQYIYKIK